jgi:hypothetical protein
MDTLGTVMDRLRPTLDLVKEVLSREVKGDTLGDPVLWLFKPQVGQRAATIREVTSHKQETFGAPPDPLLLAALLGAVLVSLIFIAVLLRSCWRLGLVFKVFARVGVLMLALTTFSMVPGCHHTPRRHVDRIGHVFHAFQFDGRLHDHLHVLHSRRGYSLC